MKKGLLSALTVAAAFALVAAPAAVVPNTAHAAPQYANGVWDSLGAYQGYVTTSYSSYRAVTTDGGDFKVKMLANNTGGSVYVRLKNDSGSIIGGEAPIPVGAAMVWTGMKAGSTVIVEMKTTGHAGYMTAEIFD